MATLLKSILTLMCVSQVLSQTDGLICQGACPVNWVQYKRKCYRAFDRPDVTWTDSRALCSGEGEGARLVVIHSAEVNAVVYNLSKHLISNPIRSQNSYPVGVLIGLNDVKREGEFIWEDGRPVTYTNWEGNPDNSMGNERCVEMRTTGKWNDYSCDQTRSHVICERKAINTYIRCLQTWEFGEEKCYKVFAQKATWSEAQGICRRENSTLPVVRSIEENTIIRSLTQENVPLGLKDRSGKRIFTWEDRSYASFSNWGGQPDNYLVENCVEMWPQGKWNDCACNYTRRGYVCEKPAESISTSPKTDKEPSNGASDGACPVSWVQYKQKCYRAFNRSDVMWNSSRALCSGEGARLVVIHSAAVNDLVNNISKRLPGVFIGLNDVEREGEFIWEDGMPVTYTNWGGEPNNVGGIERCVEMWTYGGWNDYPCDKTNPVVICERKIEKNKLCASNWTLGEEKCYKTFTQEATWVEAQDICRREAATLPVIRSIGEDTMIRNLAQKANVALGLKDRSGKRIFTWEDGSNVTFSNWRAEPTGFAEQEDCVEMWPDGTWNDIYCDVTKHGCVCEKPAVTRPSVPGETDTTTPNSEGPAQGSSDGASDGVSNEGNCQRVQPKQVPRCGMYPSVPRLLHQPNQEQIRKQVELDSREVSEMASTKLWTIMQQPVLDTTTSDSTSLHQTRHKLNREMHHMKMI